MMIGLNRLVRRASGYRTPGVLAAFLLASVVAARAGEPFSLTASTTSGTPTAISSSGSSLLNLTDNLIETKGQFATLTGQSFDASLRYGGLNKAFVYSQNSAGTSSTLSIPSIGFSKTFTGTTPDNLQHNIRQFLEHNGAGIYSQFLHSVNQNTYLGVTDGNPLATTALLADLAYDEFGLQPTDSQPVFQSDSQEERVSGGLRLDFKGGYFDTHDGSGTYGQGTLSSNWRFTDRVGLSVAALLNYRNNEGADVYNIGGEIGLPVLIVPSNGDRSLSWQVTPAFLVGGGGSVDLAAGGLFYGGAATSSLSYRLYPFTVTLADEYGYFQGYPVHIGAYNYDTDVNQQIVKNGLKVTYALNAGLSLDAGCSYTDLLNPAKVRGYYSPIAGIVFRLGSNGGLRIGCQGDFAPGYQGTSGVIQLFFGY
jgi:hypothetical protein